MGPASSGRVGKNDDPGGDDIAGLTPFLRLSIVQFLSRRWRAAVGSDSGSKVVFVSLAVAKGFHLLTGVLQLLLLLMVDVMAADNLDLGRVIDRLLSFFDRCCRGLGVARLEQIHRSGRHLGDGRPFGGTPDRTRPPADHRVFLELQDQVRALQPQRIKIRQQKGSVNVQVSIGGIR